RSSRSASSRWLREGSGHVLRRRSVQRKTDSRSLFVECVNGATLGAGVLRRRRKNLGDQLGNGFHTDPMSDETCCPVVELRQYTLVPGKRDVLVDLFEREFIESQEATGMTVIGQFRDLNNPDRFVWLRGFADMVSRAQQLGEFYGGPIWKEHRDAANATMIDSDNVLLLRPASPTSGFQLEQAKRAPVGSTVNREDLLVATMYHLGKTRAADFAALFERELQLRLTKARVSVLASFVTETHPNTFPRLPVRENVNVYVWFARFLNRKAYEESAAAIGESMREKEIAGKLRPLIVEQPEILMLSPTA